MFHNYFDVQSTKAVQAAILFLQCFIPGLDVFIFSQ